MKLFQFLPHPHLRSCIVYYWVLEGQEVFFHKIIPDGSPELIFHFGDPFLRHESSGTQQQATSILAGQLTGPITISPSGKTGVLGVKFMPAGMWEMFGINMRTVTNETAPASEVLSITSDLLNSIQECDTHEQRVAHLDHFFLRHLHSTKRPQHDKMMARISRSDEHFTIRDICEREKISPRKLERIFIESVGISAKTYLRIVRFQHVYRLLKQKNLNRADVAFLGGYFDQSHFNRDFRSFTGEDPTRYFTQLPMLSDFFMSR